LSNYTDVTKRCLWQYDEENNVTYVLCMPKTSVEKQRILYVIYGIQIFSIRKFPKSLNALGWFWQ